MAGRGGRDGERVAELSRGLRVLELGAPSALAQLMPELQALLETDYALAYHYVPAGRVVELDRLHTAGPRDSTLTFESLHGFLAATPDAWGPFRPHLTTPDQRNRVVRTYERLGDAVRQIPLNRQYLPQVGLAEFDQVRVMVTDGDEWLAYVGAFRTGLFGEREERLLAALVPALRERLILERSLGEGPVREAAFVAAIEALGRPAFVVRRAGSTLRVLHANGAGRSELAHGDASWDALVRSVQMPGAGAPYQVTDLVDRGLPGALLCVRRQETVAGERLARAQELWGLTPRQGQVLALLVRGRSNKAIGAALGCTEGTVELHVTALLHKSQSDSRAALVARFWSQL